MQLLLPPTESGTDWTCVDTHGALASGEERVLGLDQLHPSKDAVLVVPWQWMSWHRITLPPNSHRQLLPIVASLLEEELLDPIDDLHLSFEPQALTVARQGGEISVGVCKTADLQHALQALATRSCRPSRIAPELAPGESPQALQLNWVQGASQAHRICRHEQGFFAVPANNPFLPEGMFNPKPQAVRAWAEPALVKEAERWLALAGWAVPVQVQTRKDRLLDAARSPWNLAQGHFKTQSSWQHQTRAARQWLMLDPKAKGLRWGLLALVLIQGLGLVASNWQDRRELAALQTLIDQSFAQALPNTPQLDAPAQMAQALRQLEQQHGVPSTSDLGHLLAAWGQVMPQHPIEQFAYQRDELQIQGLSPEVLKAAEASPWQRLGLQARVQQQALHLRAIPNTERNASLVGSAKTEPKEVLREKAQQVLALHDRIQPLRERPLNALQVRTALQTLTPLKPNQGEWRFSAQEAVLDARQVSTAQLVQWLSDWPAHAHVSVVQAQALRTNSGWQVQLSTRMPKP